jgi:hypothetical protein
MQVLGGRSIVMANYLPESLITSGGVFAYLIHSAGLAFGFDYIYALYPLMALSFFLFFFWSLFSPLKERRLALNGELIFSLIASLFLVSSYFILFHTVYIHSNLIFGIYVFIAIIGLWNRLVRKERNWLVISFVALTTSSFCRLEGALFSLIIISVFISLEIISSKEKMFYIGAFSLIVIIWHMKLFFTLSLNTSKYFLSPKRALTVATLYVLTFVLLWLSQKRPLRKWKKYLPILMLYVLSVGWSILILTLGLRIKGGLLVLNRYGFLLLNMMKQGGWGITWIAVVLFFVVALFLKRFKHESLFIYFIFSFNPP